MWYVYIPLYIQGLKKGCEGAEWIQLTQVRVRWRFLQKRVMKIGLHENGWFPAHQKVYQFFSRVFQFLQSEQTKTTLAIRTD
jgi:hypothetical protein